MTLHDTGIIQRFEASVNGYEVDCAIAGLLVDLLGAQRAVRFRQDLEHGQTWGGYTQRLFLHPEDGGLNSRGWALSAAVFVILMSLWHGVKVDITL